MKQKIPLILAIIVGLTFVGRNLKEAKYDTAYDLDTFANLPIQTGGRILPFDSLARNSLRIIRGKQTAYTAGETQGEASAEAAEASKGEKISAIEWLADALFTPEKADNYPIFRIDHSEVLGLFGMQQESQKHFSYNDIKPHFTVITEQIKTIAEKGKQEKTPFEKAMVKLHNALGQYHDIRATFVIASNSDQVVDEYRMWEATIQPGMIAFDKQKRMEEFDEEVLKRFSRMAEIYLHNAESSDFGLVPPRDEAAREINDWANAGETLLDAIQTEGNKIDPILADYAQLIQAYRQDDATAFNTTLGTLYERLETDPALQKSYEITVWPDYPIVDLANSFMKAIGAVMGANTVMDVVEFERKLNLAEPFYTSIILYVLIFIVLLVSMLVAPQSLGKFAIYLTIFTFVLHTYGLFARMYIQNRPPVTNLYSSAIFIGWAAIFLSIIVEQAFRKHFGLFISAFVMLVASFVGFSTLIVAHNLAKTGDTLEMMRAVLDSNFWLSTHVITITLGYASMFLAGAIAIGYIFFGLLSSKIDKTTSTILYRICYGIICFSALFSFVGTMLGGIWADQSWGRFWGWDPKENGALIIVLWCALMLHARWGALVKAGGFMVLAVGGNIITSLSWFGTNMLGIGLHSYGFMDAAFWALMIFIVSQLAIMGLGIIYTMTSKSAKQAKHTAAPNLLSENAANS